ncbi:hypothetical protein [Leeuwenhoekiella sp. NPDC079379]|uniref:hypothetical protein n=1 Tax=Leeuwenhoekiella sp. NPDC079379 TaxID=3364122 RepID=UPI0037C59F2D
MLFKFFKRSKSNDNGLQHNILFAPNYLVKTKAHKNRTEYTMGGHSIINIEHEDGKNIGLYFDVTRTQNANKLSITDDESLHLGFQNIANTNYLTLGTRKNLAQSKAGDKLTLKFKDGNSITLPLESCSGIAKEKKGYACNLRTKISDDVLLLFTTKLVESYLFEFQNSEKPVNKSFEADSRRKFREAAQSFLFVLQKHY